MASLYSVPPFGDCFGSTSQRRSWTNPVPVFAREGNDRGDLSIVHQKREIASYPKSGGLAKTQLDESRARLREGGKRPWRSLYCAPEKRDCFVPQKRGSRKDAAGRIPCPSSRGRVTTVAISLLYTRKERLLRTPKAGVSQRHRWTNPAPVIARESNDRGDLSIVHQKREIASYPKIGVLAKTLGKIVLVINE